MKRIINGLRYDTETATKIGTGTRQFSDFADYQETLYVTKSGRYFLAGEGGPSSKWAQPCGNSGSMGGSGIIPLEKDEALEWSERHLSAADMETHFPDSINDA